MAMASPCTSLPSSNVCINSLPTSLAASFRQHPSLVRSSMHAFSAWKPWDSISEPIAVKQTGKRGVPRLKVASEDGGRISEGKAGEAVLPFDISRLEAYTERVPSEVLLVNALVDDEEDQVVVFKGFSSSLSRPTPEDLWEPVLPPTTIVLSIDRVQGPYNPAKARYIQQGVSWREFDKVLQSNGL